MANQKVELQSTELFEELSDADLMTVVGGVLGTVTEGLKTVVTNATGGLTNTTTGATQDGIADIPASGVNGLNNTITGISDDIFFRF
ncbi:hypothetical protein [Iningainema tapete]|uniref:Uncharacterized protein n=1 Tax=Iningainema tapete BLCC-T55 TaxID=2748662 RepID=A0A8J6XKH5_9CYAN|nr:hypothetical protein [Iningainema tapete]MBD2777864.1 hypothetical protein [Iningainema tapete BLCC-T55]